ncbi:hypothetical protein K28_24890, partial [Klebsiella pneumoniae]
RGGDRAQARLAFGKGGEDVQLAFGAPQVGSSARAKWLTTFTGWRTFYTGSDADKRLGFLRAHP